MTSISTTLFPLSKAAKRRARESKRIKGGENIDTAAPTKEPATVNWAANYVYGSDQCSKWAFQTVKIMNDGYYISPLCGVRIEVKEARDKAFEHTKIHWPTVSSLIISPTTTLTKTVIEITQESTLEAAYRLCVIEAKANTSTSTNVPPTTTTTLPSVSATSVTKAATNTTTKEIKSNQVALLNFASAKNPGGGFMNGRETQEEKLAVCSGLFYCIGNDKCLPFYTTHGSKREASTATPEILAMIAQNTPKKKPKQAFYGAYTDTIIYSPQVPVIRLDNGRLLEEYFVVDIITCAAVNKVVSKVSDHIVKDAMRSRIAHILAAAKKEGATQLILGAFGCGVFKNDPVIIAGLFKELLSTQFKGCFQRVVFALFCSNSEDSRMLIWQQAFHDF